MSVCLSIKKLLPDVKYLGTDFEKMSEEEREEFFLPEDVFKERYSDNKEHQFLDLTCEKIISKNCGKNRYWKKIKQMQLPYNTLTLNNGYTYHATTVDLIAYRQGWFLKNRFFKKNCTMYMTNKKSEMISFMKKYFDFTDPKAVECYQLFVKIFKDGMIFDCSF